MFVFNIFFVWKGQMNATMVNVFAQICLLMVVGLKPYGQIKGTDQNK